MNPQLFDVLLLVMAALVGIGSALIGSWSERRIADRKADAEWTVTAFPLDLVRRAKARGWRIENTGTKPATDVSIEIERGKILREGEAPTAFAPNEGEYFFAEEMGNLRLQIEWTSHRGVRRSAVRLLDLV